MQKSILAHIASDFISEYENVANSSIAYLLNEYPASHEALKSILDVDEVPRYYKTEESTKSNGRPDVTGFDASNNKTVIIEGKFWANLTDNQPCNYLKELSETGKILFLAPDKRISSLRLEIDRRLDGNSERVVIYSWISFLNLIEKENNKDHNHHLASDLIQIKELCQRMDAEGMPPLSLSDLDPMNGRVNSHFIDVLQECNGIIRHWEISDFRIYNWTPSSYGAGFFFRANNLGCHLGFDGQKWFVRDAHTPFWLSVKEIPAAGDWVTSKNICDALKEYDSDSSHEEEYGITLKSGMDKNQVVNHIVNTTKDILVHLGIKFSND